jgi:hypothetical protein
VKRLILEAAVSIAAPSLERVADIPLPGSASRFDYQSIDTTTDRLYISHMGAGEMVVFDLKTRQVVGPSATSRGPQGCWPSPPSVRSSPPSPAIIRWL